MTVSENVNWRARITLAKIVSLKIFSASKRHADIYCRAWKPPTSSREGGKCSEDTKMGELDSQRLLLKSGLKVAPWVMQLPWRTVLGSLDRALSMSVCAGRYLVGSNAFDSGPDRFRCCLSSSNLWFCGWVWVSVWMQVRMYSKLCTQLYILIPLRHSLIFPIEVIEVWSKSNLLYPQGTVLRKTKSALSSWPIVTSVELLVL